MDSIYAGWWSILPPVLAIVLALITKEVISSLLLGILSGTVIYACMAGLNPIVAPISIFFDMAIDKIDLYIVFFCFLLGALVHLVSKAGGTKAYGAWAIQKLKTKRSAMFATSALGCMIFIDDYFNCLTVGTVMKPLTDRHKISRAKLAYLIDSTAAPVCIIAPISSWAAAVGSNLRSTGAFTSDFSAFCATIPYNLYALLSLAMVFTLCAKDLDFGPMRKQEQIAQETGDLGNLDETSETDESTSGRATLWDMLVPICVLIVVAILSMLYDGGLWGDDPAYHNLIAALGNCTAGKALCWGGLAAIFVAFFQFVPRKLIAFPQFMKSVSDGFASMVNAVTILVLAWTIGGVCRDLLQTSAFVSNAMSAGNVPGWLLPPLIFVLAAFLSFSTGTSWGTFGILIPIVVPVAMALDTNLLVVALSATLAGSILGDHCSPISDTTILSSTGAGCDHLVHVSTQMPYAGLVAICCIIGYTVAGISGGNLLLTWLSSFGCMFAAIAVLHRFSKRKRAPAPLPATD